MKKVLNYFIEKYGEVKGTKKFNHAKNQTHSASLTKLIEKYGEEVGIDRYLKHKDCLSYSRTLPAYIEKYGEVEGTKRYKEKNSHLSVGVEALRKSGKTEEQILELKRKHSNESSHSLKRYIEKYGEEEGNLKYDRYVQNRQHQSPRCVGYWLKLGFDSEMAEKLRKTFQRSPLTYQVVKYGKEEALRRIVMYTNYSTLKRDIYKKELGEAVGNKVFEEANDKRGTHIENYIKKYGEEEGVKRFDALLLGHRNFSKLEFDFLNEVIAHYPDTGRDNLYYGEKQWKFGLRKEEWSYFNKKVFWVDFLDRDQKKIIEVNGDIFHFNPKFYTENSTNHINATAKVVWEKDRKRYEFFQRLGYTCLVVWEYDILNHREETIKNTIKFLLGEKNESSK